MSIFKIPNDILLLIIGQCTQYEEMLGLVLSCRAMAKLVPSLAARLPLIWRLRVKKCPAAEVLVGAESMTVNPGEPTGPTYTVKYSKVSAENIAFIAWLILRVGRPKGGEGMDLKLLTISTRFGPYCTTSISAEEKAIWAKYRGIMDNFTIVTHRRAHK